MERCRWRAENVRGHARLAGGLSLIAGESRLDLGADGMRDLNITRYRLLRPLVSAGGRWRPASSLIAGFAVALTFALVITFGPRSHGGTALAGSVSQCPSPVDISVVFDHTGSM